MKARREAIVVDSPREILVNPWEDRRINASLERVAVEVCDRDYRNPMLDLSPFPESDLADLVKSVPRQSVADMVSDLLAA